MCSTTFASRATYAESHDWTARAGRPSLNYRGHAVEYPKNESGAEIRKNKRASATRRSTISHDQEATRRYFLRETSSLLQGAEVGSQKYVRYYLLGDDTLPRYRLPQFAGDVTTEGLEFVVRHAAGELSRRELAALLLRLAILKAFLLIPSSEGIDRHGGRDSSSVRALCFQDDWLEGWGGTSTWGRRGRRRLDLVYVGLHGLERKGRLLSGVVRGTIA